VVNGDPGVNGDPTNERQASQHHGRAERITKIAAYGIVGVIGIVFFYSGYCVFRAVSSGAGKWHNTGIADWSLLGVTSAYVIATILQWQALRDSIGLADEALAHARESSTAQLKETRRANELTLRAWVLVESADYTEGDRSVSVTVRNYGRLPATHVAALHKFVVGPMYLFPEPPDGAAPELGVIGAIGAGLSHIFVFPLDDTMVNELAAARRGERRGGLTLHLFSRFRYTDALADVGTQRHTTYSVVIGGGHFLEIPGGNSVS